MRTSPPRPVSKRGVDVLGRYPLGHPRATPVPCHLRIWFHFRRLSLGHRSRLQGIFLRFILVTALAWVLSLLHGISQDHSSFTQSSSQKTSPTVDRDLRAINERMSPQTRFPL